MQSFLAQMLGASWMEIVASLSGLLCVYLIIKRNIWCWPVGLLQVSLYAVIFFQVKLYSDVMLQCVYVVMQLYGWWYWLTGKRPDGELKIEATGGHLLLVWVPLTLVGSGLLGWGMSSWTDASLPWADAFITTASLVAQWLLSRRVLINWLFWIAVDVVAIGTYSAKSLVPTAVLYTVFLCMATSGLVIWLRVYRRQATACV